MGKLEMLVGKVLERLDRPSTLLAASPQLASKRSPTDLSPRASLARVGEASRPPQSGGLLFAVQVVEQVAMLSIH